MAIPISEPENGDSCAEAVVPQKEAQPPPDLWPNFGYLLSEKCWQDCVIQCRQRRLCKVNRALFMAASTIFAEAAENQIKGKRIKLDVDVEDFKQIVTYLYHGHAEINLRRLPTFLEAIHQFQVKWICEDFEKLLSPNYIERAIGMLEGGPANQNRLRKALNQLYRQWWPPLQINKDKDNAKEQVKPPNVANTIEPKSIGYNESIIKSSWPGDSARELRRTQILSRRLKILKRECQCFISTCVSITKKKMSGKGSPFDPDWYFDGDGFIRYRCLACNRAFVRSKLRLVFHRRICCKDRTV